MALIAPNFDGARSLCIDDWVKARLAFARPVALAKLARRLPIEDKAREAQVLDRVRNTLKQRGLSPSQVTRYARFFAAQIEASKQAQRAWQAEWIRVGAPMEPIPTLANLRIQINALDERFIKVGYPRLRAGAMLRPRFLNPAWQTALAGARAFLPEGH